MDKAKDRLQDTIKSLSKEKLSPKALERQSSGVIADHPLGWLMTIIAPVCCFLYLRHAGFHVNTSMFVAIISIALVIWIFSLLEAFIAPLFAILMILLFGLAPSNVVLSGFSSDSFMLTFSVLGLGSVITSTGLTKRYTLLLIKKLPEHTFFYQLALFGTGLIFTPVVPSIPGRTCITAPILEGMTRDLDEKSRKRASPMLYSGGLDGVTFLSAIFLTGAPANLFIFGLLSKQDQQAFQFLHWLYAASVTGIIMLVLYFSVSSLYFRAMTRVTVDRRRVRDELESMGSMTWREWMAFICIAILAVGVVTTSLHKIKIPFIAFAVLIVLLFFGILTPSEFRNKIDWTFLFLLGSVIGIIATMKHLHIDRLIMTHLTWLGQYMRDDFKVFILILTSMIMFVRLFLPMATTNFIFAAALLPLADAGGVSPWLIGFLILIISETSLMNYQSPHITLYRDKGGILPGPMENRVIFFRAILLVVKIAAIYMSMPFWTRIGIL